MRGVEPRVTSSSRTASQPPAAPKVAAPAVPDGGAPTGLILLGLLGAAGIGAGLVIARRRRGAGGIAVAEEPQSPLAPAHADALVDAELHEIIAEERARALLSGESADRLESTGTR